MMQSVDNAGPEPWPCCLLRGIDSLYVSFYLDLFTSELDFEDLAFRKQQAQSEYSTSFVVVVLGSERFALLPFGKAKYKYVLANDLFEVRLSEGMQPSCHIQFYSKALWQCGLDELMERFERWRASLSIVTLRPEVISRVDWAFDFHDETMDFAADDFVTRSVKDAIYRERKQVQTFTFGRGDIVVRVYDKSAEIEQESGKVWLYDLWGRKDGVWRVEFQVRGPRLKAGNIRTIDDLKAFQNDLLRELATQHTTLRRPSGDTNRSRWPLHPLWQSLCAEIDELPQSGLIRSFDEAHALSWRLEKQLRALYGSLKGIAAVDQLRRGQTDVTPLPELMERVTRLLERHHSQTLWREDIERRITGYGLGQW
jgi:hypothetical protein